MARQTRLTGIALYCFGVALLSASAAVVFSGPFWARTYLTPLAWAGILLVLDGLNGALSGNSLLLNEPGRFLGLFALSIPWRLVFELMNLRLKDWAYDGLPAAAGPRWGSCALAFGAALPALAEARQLLENALPLKRISGRPFRLSEGLRDTMRLLGLASLVLPLLWPGTFFPLAWAFAFLLLEPGASRVAPLESPLFDLSMGGSEAVLAWGGAGLLCGFLAEAVNWWAGGRWVYTLPWEAGPRLFELPLAGYAAFPVFALGCASLITIAFWIWPRLGVGARATTVFGLAAFSAAAFTALDAYTVRSFVP
jgi:hypothetical protein